ncbi:MAG: hypothetical protein V4558_02240 [Gemmatimonadota bacterium]
MTADQLKAVEVDTPVAPFVGAISVGVPGRGVALTVYVTLTVVEAAPTALSGTVAL